MARMALHTRHSPGFTHRWAALWVHTLCLLLGLCGPAAAAESVKLATGEYVPFVSEKLPDGGVTAAIVTAAFKAQGIDVNNIYMPWKRGFVETSRGRYIGTFPYLRTTEREVDFLYSKPIYADQFRLFVRRDSDVDRNWSKRTICVPLGYDTTQIDAFTKEHQIRIETPAEIASCFKMLQTARVDAVWVSELVGAATITSTLGEGANVRMLDLILVGAVDYFLIVSRQLPNAQDWITRFDAGLKTIRADGTYQRIVQRYNINTHTTTPSR